MEELLWIIIKSRGIDTSKNNIYKILIYVHSALCVLLCIKFIFPHKTIKLCG